MVFSALFGPSPPVLKGKAVTLRAARMSDFREWASLRGASRAFLEPWEPSWAFDELERAPWRQRLSRYGREYAQGAAMSLLIFENQTGRLTGGISMGNIRRGVAQSAQIGYWMGEQHAGKGYMGAAIRLLLEHGFDVMRLNRIEAACIPDNERSIRVLEKAGFRREGLLRSYLRINGAWRDHFLYAITADDYRQAKRG
ncbi:GNAT family N-acetyltransferase [Chelativorans sp. ZYF759]|uniref:GNAT family N-acetyltransferase n=1 Tax=Chelativorans sp. ZYF759 TaxID=2692213 RepID=UPI00145FA274|nr:GNAT family protein [Chelativorans sp. ZYF759]NMG38898.1 GNAT family N-acetyltransferase [Chelativorans sp. ZYF759]